MWALVDEVIDFEADEDDIQYFTQGKCMALAYEIYKLTGWTLALISNYPIDSNEDVMGHLFIIDPDGMAIDIVGRRTLDDLSDDWYFCPYIHRFFNLAEFKKEMNKWKAGQLFNKDKRAKQWAAYIVDVLS